MNAISQTFDLKRFGLNLKRDLLSDWRSWLTRLLMITGTTTLAMIIATYHDDNSYYLYDAISLFKVFAMVFCALGASLFMKNMSTKGLRLNSLMSPASELEKFLTRWVICIVGVFLCYLVCFAIADILRVAIISFFINEYSHYSLMGPLTVMLSDDVNLNFWLSLISTQSFFLLGSTVWPKDSFRKTFGAMIIMMAACGFIFTSISAWINRSYVFVGYDDHRLWNMIYANRIYLYATFILFCYAVSWFRFRESEIIHRF